MGSVLWVRHKLSSEKIQFSYLPQFPRVSSSFCVPLSLGYHIFNEHSCTPQTVCGWSTLLLGQTGPSLRLVQVFQSQVWQIFPLNTEGDNPIPKQLLWKGMRLNETRIFLPVFFQSWFWESGIWIYISNGKVLSFEVIALMKECRSI